MSTNDCIVRPWDDNFEEVLKSVRIIKCKGKYIYRIATASKKRIKYGRLLIQTEPMLVRDIIGQGESNTYLLESTSNVTAKRISAIDAISLEQTGPMHLPTATLYDDHSLIRIKTSGETVLEPGTTVVVLLLVDEYKKLSTPFSSSYLELDTLSVKVAEAPSEIDSAYVSLDKVL